MGKHEDKKCDDQKAQPSAPIAPVQPLKDPNVIVIPKAAAELLRRLQHDVTEREHAVEKSRAALNVAVKMLELITPAIKQGQGWSLDLERGVMTRDKEKK